jgi:hypothetical protein
MGKYLMLWQLNPSLIPVDPQERGKGFTALMNLIEQDIEKGITKDWGSFVGERNGYCIVEGSEVDVARMVQQYSPFCGFLTHPIASFDQMKEMLKSLSG